MAYQILKTEHSQRGASIIEFAVILPVLLVILFGIIEFGFILYDKAMLTNAAREGARAGIVAQAPRLSDTAITTIVQGYCGAHLVTFGGGTPTPTVAISRTGTVFQDDLTVSVAYPYTFLFVPNFVPGLPPGVNLNAEVVMKYE